LQLTTATTVNSVADLLLGISSAPGSLFVGGVVTNTIVVTNLGPVSASSVVVTHSLPLGAIFVSATASQGTVTPSAGLVTANLGTLPFGANARVTIAEVPSLAGTMFNIASVAANETDLNPVNNTAQANVSVISPTAARVSAALNNNALIEITVTGEPNLSYILQGSTNLVSWVPLTTNVAASGTFKYIDSSSQTLKARYYRAVRRL